MLRTGCWSGTADFHGFGGTSRDLTLPECQAACIDSRTCVAIDWEPDKAGETCWILTIDYIAPTLDLGVITHYELNRTCAGKLR